MLPWLEKNVVAVLARLQEGDRRALASKEERATRWGTDTTGVRGSNQ